MFQKAKPMNKTQKIENAFSVRQPWGWAITCGFKAIENRSRNCKFRGRVAVHSSKTADHDPPGSMMYACKYDKKMIKAAHLDEDFELDDRYDPSETYATSAIIGSVEIYDCVRVEDLKPAMMPKDFQGTKQKRFADGPFCILMREPRRYRVPIACHGKISVPWKMSAQIQRYVANAEKDLVTFRQFISPTHKLAGTI